MTVRYTHWHLHEAGGPLIPGFYCDQCRKKVKPKPVPAASVSTPTVPQTLNLAALAAELKAKLNQPKTQPKPQQVPAPAPKPAQQAANNTPTGKVKPNSVGYPLAMEFIRLAKENQDYVTFEQCAKMCPAYPTDPAAWARAMGLQVATEKKNQRYKVIKYGGH